MLSSVRHAELIAEAERYRRLQARPRAPRPTGPTGRALRELGTWLRHPVRVEERWTLAH
ncbi:hypothetical protein [Georgenia muralis]